MNLNVLVYSGPEASQSLSVTLSTLKNILFPHYAVQLITPQAVCTEPWTDNCALFILPRLRSFNNARVASSLGTFVENGGSLLSLSTGATFSSVNYQITPSPLRFYDKSSGNYLCLGLSVVPEPEDDHVCIRSFDGNVVHDVHKNARCQIFGSQGERVQTLANYIKDDAVLGIAAFSCSICSGRVAVIAPSVEDILEDHATRHFLAFVFRQLGLVLPTGRSPSPTASPLPQFITSLPSKSSVITAIANALSCHDQPTILRDAADTFSLYKYSEDDIPPIFEKARSETDTRNIYIIICTEGVLPVRDQIPRFDLRLFYDTVLSLRTANSDASRLGDIVIYGESVTSTQTLIERNPQLMAALPDRTVSLASRQLTGRGRGGNVWLSPTGSLAFTLLLRVPLTQFPGSKLVFVQYIFALALTEACRADTILGATAGSRVRIKWPNDVYAVLDDGEKKKIAGILVNTSFSDGQIHILIGCGLNVLNEAPLLSLRHLDNTRELSIERTAAQILVTFEEMWDKFVAERGSFDSFDDLYFQRWLHSDQLVTITTMTPPCTARIVGITADHGRLRVLPERGDKFIDLQPDGNSFDLMAGLIRAKT
ncbi:class II aaRS and biotin synthetase [Fistulina hepatica ATCC 64428]|uniref:Class II aaRS and biotin synthetase n=1 Tax=Fistulina hepatica ATCC 64428 TaxID=1128425 RepID=A0A0D7AFD3_9AGAR|nr:class II aaRS and biotin synthetase [Fistulina hepatica ATCC 64428]